MTNSFGDKSIQQFWNLNPVGSNFVEYHNDKSFYENYDKFRYSTESHILSELDNIDLKGKKVLEIGLGQGADSQQLIKRGAIFYGIDLTEESVRRITERFRMFNVPYESIMQANAVSIPHDDHFFDVVYSHGVIHHSPDIGKIVEEIYRVLKPGGKAVIMLYHKNSFNYYISILFLRRIGLLLIYVFPRLIRFVSKLTGEQEDRIQKHIINLKRDGFKYLQIKNFVHKSTDGPDNVWATVWTRKSSKLLFKGFRNFSAKTHFLNERHLLGLQHILPSLVKKKIANIWGWHLWIFADK